MNKEAIPSTCHVSRLGKRGRWVNCLALMMPFRVKSSAFSSQRCFAEIYIKLRAGSSSWLSLGRDCSLPLGEQIGFWELLSRPGPLELFLLFDTAPVLQCGLCKKSVFQFCPLCSFPSSRVFLLYMGQMEEKLLWSFRSMRKNRIFSRQIYFIIKIQDYLEK